MSSTDAIEPRAKEHMSDELQRLKRLVQDEPHCLLSLLRDRHGFFMLVHRPGEPAQDFDLRTTSRRHALAIIQRAGFVALPKNTWRVVPWHEGSTDAAGKEA